MNLVLEDKFGVKTFQLKKEFHMKHLISILGLENFEMHCNYCNKDTVVVANVVFEYFTAVSEAQRHPIGIP